MRKIISCPISRLGILLSLFAVLLAACGKSKPVDPTVVREAFFDRVLAFHAGTAGSSLGRAAAAANVLDFAVSYPDAELEPAWDTLSEEEKLEFRENYDSVAYLLEQTWADPEQYFGLYDDAGVLEKMQKLLQKQGAETAWKALREKAEALPGEESIDDDYRLGMAALERGDYDAAYIRFQRAIDLKNTEAMIALGYMYQAGFASGVSAAAAKPDAVSAIAYYKLAARNGDPEGFYRLGMMYWAGSLVDADLEKAKEYFSEGSRMEHLGCLYQLGVTHAILEEEEDAFRCFSDAALRGHSGAMLRLAEMYEQGRGTETDPEKAAEWYDLALGSAAVEGNEEQMREARAGLERVGGNTE